MRELLKKAEETQKKFGHLLRQLDVIPIKHLSQPITVIGAGAIGSFTVLNLAKMGFSDITVYDFDSVSEENMNAQWFRFKDIGKQKVDALKELLSEFTKTELKVKNERYEGGPLSGIVISAVDSMKARQIIWKNVKGKKQIPWFIDSRMAVEEALTYVVDPMDKKDQVPYEKSLYTDANAVPERCTAKSTMYTSTLIGGYVAKHVKDLVTGEPYARNTQWNIKDNVLQNWRKEQKHNHRHILPKE